jgi:hypothetical protein
MLARAALAMESFVIVVRDQYARIRPSGVLQAVVKSDRLQWLRRRAAARGNGEILMLGTCRRVSLGILLAALAQTALAQTSDPAPAPTTAARHHKSHRKTLKPLVLPPLPSGPLSQLPMDQIPPTPAKVSYQGGLLTISAQNSTLGEILRDVRKLTGASIEVPPGSAVTGERVIAHLGPGAPRDVLAGLFNGTQFNYVMLGSSSDPTAVSSVVLTLKTSAAGETQTATNAYQNNPGPMPPNRFPQPQAFNQQLVVPQPGNGQPAVGQPANAEGDDSKDEEQDNADDNADADDQAQPGQPVQPGVDGNVQDQQVQPDPNQPNAGPKTPEQILEMLRRQQPPGAVIPPPPPQQ